MPNLFSTNNFVKFRLDILFFNTRYVDWVTSKENHCMFCDVCNNPQLVCTMFYFILLRLLSNRFIGLLNSFETLLKISLVSSACSDHDLLMSKSLKESLVQCTWDILNDLCFKMSPDVFYTIYKDFRPNVDYKCSCFKIINIHYLEYIKHKFDKK